MDEEDSQSIGSSSDSINSYDAVFEEGLKTNAHSLYHAIAVASLCTFFICN
jgi:hypothetical protein